jgi:hypothetical protein
MGKKISPGEKIPVRFDKRERELILDFTIILDDNLTDPLESAVPDDKGLYVIHYTLNELEDLVGFISGEANHTNSRDLENDFDLLIDKLEEIGSGYDIVEE